MPALAEEPLAPALGPAVEERPAVAPPGAALPDRPALGAVVPAVGVGLVPATGVELGDSLLAGVASAPHAEKSKARDITVRDARYLSITPR